MLNNTKIILFVQPLRPEERNLIDLELMIMEQVADWELDVGKVEPESSRVFSTNDLN